MDTLDDLVKAIDTLLEVAAAMGGDVTPKMVQDIYAIQDRYVEILCPGYREVKNLFDQAERWPSYSDYTGIFYSLRRLIELSQIDFVAKLVQPLYEECECPEYPENFKHAEFRVSLKRMLDVLR